MEKKKKKVSEEARKFFEFMHGPAVMEKIDAYTADNEKYKDFEKAVKEGEIAYILAYGESGWAAYGTDEGIQHKLFNIITGMLESNTITEECLLAMIAFICAGMRKMKREEKKDEKED